MSSLVPLLAAVTLFGLFMGMLKGAEDGYIKDCMDNEYHN